ncbi:beta-propeller domain-containing protein [Candidatus Poriferisodalis sp.]|uniref:beta-propeller domain-containing protein n=1 Tax=Candidatus Poriferisodalis sp. TaxID=3101277 RepID=UPI003B029956
MDASPVLRRSLARLLGTMTVVMLAGVACAGEPVDSVSGDSAVHTRSTLTPARVEQFDVVASGQSDADGSSVVVEALGGEASGISGEPESTAPVLSAQSATSGESAVSTAPAQSSAPVHKQISQTPETGPLVGSPEERPQLLPTHRASVDAAPAAALDRFAECGALLGYFQANAAEITRPWGLGSQIAPAADSGLDIAMAGDAAASDSSASGQSAPMQAGADYSISNVHEAGLDEPDSLKTDGRRIVVATDNLVRVVDVTGPTPTLAATIDLGPEWGWKLLMHGDRVLALKTHWGSLARFAGSGPGREQLDWGPTNWGPTTEVVEIDLARSVPAIASRLSVEGEYVGARMTDGVVRLITRSQPKGIWWVYPETSDVAAAERAADANRRIIAETTIEHWLPNFILRDEAGEPVDAGHLGDCDRFWAPTRYAGPGTLSITTVDIAENGLAGPMDTTSIAADGSTVYASRNYLYVTTTDWFGQRDRFADLRDGPLDESGPNVVATEIHVFDTSAPGSSAYVGSASVMGTVLNQYSMSEHEGHLRIATTVARSWRSDGSLDSENFVTVFAVGDDGLSETGQVGGLGVGERIYAVRYLGDVAAVVTFRQVDPLYLLDMADPTAPTVRGELKINGYSAYLHPLDGDVLLGVGQEATDEGLPLGAQVSMFDIADLDRPRRIDQWILPESHTAVEFDALAFLHWSARSVAVLPVEQHPSNLSPPFIGAVVLSTADRALTERSRLTHAAPPVRTCREPRDTDDQGDRGDEVGPAQLSCWYEADWSARIVASAVIGDRLYLASSKAFGSVDLMTLEPVSQLNWAS